jgi:protein-S-isoprenylcysteine O-methyltransferase Ste14
MMKKIQVSTKKLGTIAHYLGVIGEYFIVVFLAIWFDNVLKIPSLFYYSLRALGLILSAFGLFIIVWCCWLQFTVGQGTTSFSEPTKKLVTCGPYRIVRNPMMYGQFLVFKALDFS